mmetsp:Transcript_20938/g.26703  ORF Transcript_20938/g.26703 Transcript_20938/m.26703 type:complete len:147 (+) Transcript_20938:481-921(+)
MQDHMESSTTLSDKWFGNHIVIATTTHPLHDSRIGILVRFGNYSRLRKRSWDTDVWNALLRMLSFLGQHMIPIDTLVLTATDIYLKYFIMISNVLVSLKKIRIFGQEIDDLQFLAFAPMGCYCGVRMQLYSRRHSSLLQSRAAITS